MLEEKQLNHKENLELALEESKFRLKEFETKGLEVYEKYKELVITIVKKNLQEDIDFFKNKLKEMENAGKSSNN
jgi:hypothetical protein